MIGEPIRARALPPPARGANFLVPRESDLRVLALAPRQERVERLRSREGLDAKAAKRRLDEDRANFIHRNYYADVSDPQHHDLVLDSSVFGLDGSVELICAALEVRSRAQRG